MSHSHLLRLGGLGGLASLRAPEPDQALEATPSSVRSGLASAAGRGSPRALGVKIEQRTPSTFEVTVRGRWLRIMDLHACAETLSAHCRFSAILPLHWGRTRQRG